MRSDVAVGELAAWHYAPEQRSGACVVMAHGFSLTRHDGLDTFAQAFAAAGADVLVFDHRFLGDSGGEPRQRVRIAEQMADWRAMIGHARRLEGVDKVVLWGFSMSGGHAVSLALEDPSIDGVLALCPFLNGLQRALSGKVTTTAKILPRAVAALAGSKTMIPVSAPPGQLGAMSLPGEHDGFGKVVPAGSPWRNEVSPALFATITLHRPYAKADRIRCPLWVGLGEQDISVHKPSVVAAAEKAPDAELVRYPEHDHWTPFVGDAPARIAADQVDFLRRRGLLPAAAV